MGHPMIRGVGPAALVIEIAARIVGKIVGLVSGSDHHRLILVLDVPPESAVMLRLVPRAPLGHGVQLLVGSPAIPPNPPPFDGLFGLRTSALSLKSLSAKLLISEALSWS